MSVDFDTRLNRIVADHEGNLTQAIADVVRQNVADEMTRYLVGKGPVTKIGQAPPARSSVRARTRARRILPCIAPDCANPSKGPRFRYLCGDHLHASKREYLAWREARRS